MYVILSYRTDRRAEGILLAASSSRMRIVVRKVGDTIELRLVDGRWISDDGDPIEIESMIPDELTYSAALFSLFPRTHSARN